ncbi:MAG TPA: hypothetical protein VKV19_19760 [Ktedonobacteraceae bacterium]|nr:hypothetical protein [Ktedonobacteraceae bacterium]
MKKRLHLWLVEYRRKEPRRRVSSMPVRWLAFLYIAEDEEPENRLKEWRSRQNCDVVIETFRPVQGDGFTLNHTMLPAVIEQPVSSSS